MKYKLLYTNGDSFAAGEELALPDLYPDIAELYTTTEFYQKITSVGRTTPPNTPEYRKRCKELCYSKTVADSLGIDIVNDALGGQANQVTVASTFMRLESDLLTRYNPEDIFVIINLTGFDRMKLPNKDAEFKCQSFMLNYPYPGSSSVHDFLIREVVDEYSIVDNLIHINFLKNYLESKKIQHLFVDSVLYERSMANTRKTIKHLLHTKTMMVKPSMAMISEFAFANEKVVHTNGHYSQVIHDRFAAKIVDYIKKT